MRNSERSEDVCFPSWGRRFEAIAANTGLGPQLVAARLKLLEREGVVERHAYQERPPRNEYRLTAKGKDLFDVLYAMRNWAERWAYDDGEIGPGPAMRYIHRACGADVGTSTVCPGCGEPLRYGDLKDRKSTRLNSSH